MCVCMFVCLCVCMFVCLCVLVRLVMSSGIDACLSFGDVVTY